MSRNKDEKPITAKLIQAVGLSKEDAEHVAAEVKQWIEDPDSRPSKSIHATGKLIVTGKKDDETLLLIVTDSTNLAGIAISRPDPQGLSYIFRIFTSDYLIRHPGF